MGIKVSEKRQVRDFWRLKFCEVFCEGFFCEVWDLITSTLRLVHSVYRRFIPYPLCQFLCGKKPRLTSGIFYVLFRALTLNKNC